MLTLDLQYFGGRGASYKKKRNDDILPPNKTNPIADKNFKVENQKPTKATMLDNMNEAQLSRELLRLSNRIGSAEKEMDKANNSSSARWFRELSAAFPGGVGGSAITPSYQRKVENYINQATKYVAAKEKSDSYTRQFEAYKKAYDTVKGSGLLVHEAETAMAATRGKLDGKWTKTDKAVIDNFGNSPRAISGQKNGDFAIAKNWGTYRVYMNGREIGSFDKANEAKTLIEKYAKKKS